MLIICTGLLSAPPLDSIYSTTLFEMNQRFEKWIHFNDSKEEETLYDTHLIIDPLFSGNYQIKLFGAMLKFLWAFFYPTVPIQHV